MRDSESLLPIERIDKSILIIRNNRVMLDYNLANIYGVETKRLKEAVRRNINRFPEEFMFELTQEEFTNLRTQFASSSWGGLRHAPFAFTEHGTDMLASVLNSPIAIQASIQVVKAFVRLREIISTNKEFSHKLEKLKNKYDEKFKIVFKVIKHLMNLPQIPPGKQIGFRQNIKDKKGRQMKSGQ